MDYNYAMTENTLHIVSHTSLPETIEAAAEHLLSVIDTQLNQGKTVVFLLAGGSAAKVYVQAAQILKQKIVSQQLAPHAYENLVIAVGDERWPEKNNTADALKSGLLDILTPRGASFLTLPDEATAPKVAEKYEEWLRDIWRQENVFTLAMVGVGGDGHTLGVNGDEDQLRFSELFEKQPYFVGYTSNATTAAFPQFPTRVTLTLTGLEKVDQVIGLVAGEDKKAVIEELGSRNPRPAHLFPAGALLSKKGKLFTDNSL